MIVWLLRLLWLGLCVAVLVWALNAAPATEAHVAHGWAMVVLTFPIGLFGLFAVGAAAYLSLTLLSLELSGPSGLVLLWSVMTALGYIQWFVLVPEILRRRKALARTKG